MKRTFLLVALLLSAFSAAQAQSKYDLNGDGSVNVGDVTKLVNVILGKDAESGEVDPTELTATDDGNRWTDGTLLYAFTSEQKRDVAVVGVADRQALVKAVVPAAVKIDDVSYKVTTVGNYAFQGCTELTSVTLPSSVTTIGDWAFSGCTYLTSFTIPSSVTRIGNDAFEYCTGLRSISIPESVTRIGDYVFRGCTGLTSVSIPESVLSIGNDAFAGCSGLRSVSIPESVMSIGNEAFYGCTGLTSITIPSSVTRIGDGVFRNCTGARSLTISESITSIAPYAFAGCIGLQSISIPESVTTIEDDAFDGCKGVRSVSIPSSVTRIGNYAFVGCTGLKDIYALRTDPAAYNCATDAFNDYSATLHVPSGSKEAYASTAPWSKFVNIVEDIDTGIEPLTLTPSETGQTYYNLQGQRITNPQRGQLVIVRYADGTSRKVVVK